MSKTLARVVDALERIADALEAIGDAGDEVAKPLPVAAEPGTAAGWRKLIESTKRAAFLLPDGSAFVVDDGDKRALIVLRADGEERNRIEL